MSARTRQSCYPTSDSDQHVRSRFSKRRDRATELTPPVIRCDTCRVFVERGRRNVYTQLRHPSNTCVHIRAEMSFTRMSPGMGFFQTSL